MSRRAVIAFAVCFGLLLLAVLGRSSTFTVEKKELVKAPPETLFALVNDLHKWPEWSPWDSVDPQLKRSFGGPNEGVGANQTWSGNEAMGEGTFTITQSTPPSKVVLSVTFVRPKSEAAELTFTFTPGPFGTEAVWTYTGHHTVADKFNALVVNPSGVLGPSLELGLGNLKRLAEEAARPKAPEPAPAPTEADAGVPSPEAVPDAGAATP